MSAPVVWALVHDLDRTGVPIDLVRLAGWLADAGPPAHLHVVAGRDGVLRRDLERLGVGVAIAGTVATGGPATDLARVLRRADRPELADRWLRVQAARAVRALPAPDVVLLHGLGAWSTWRALRPTLDPRARLAVHVHELELGLDRSVPAGHRRHLLGGAHAVLAVAPPVADLAIRWGARPAVTTVVPGVTDLVGPTRPAAPIRTVLGVGTAGWRKGTDRFVAVAREVGRRRPGTDFAWIGPLLPAAERWAVDADLPVRWDGEVADPWAFHRAGTILLVPSREDPLPLVALEAGGRGVPVVAADTGGLADLLADGRGAVVAGHDLAAMAAAVGRWIEDPRAAAEAGERLRRHVAAHHTVEAVGPAWAAAVLGA